MKNYELAILCTEAFSLIVLGVIIYGSWFESKSRSPRKRAYVDLLLGVFGTVLLDMTTYLPVDWSHAMPMLYALTLGAMIMPFLVWQLFARYIFHYYSEKVHMSKTGYFVCSVICMVGIATTLYYGLTGMIFSVENGVYQVGEYYEGYMATYLVAGAFMMVMLAVKGKQLGLHDTLAAMSFQILPLFGVLLSVLVPGLEFGVSALAISCLIMNTVMQANQEQVLMSTQKETNRKARLDELTQVNNRLSFNEVCEELQNGRNVSLGVIFADINGLKYINDHYGHKSGDTHIQSFVTLLQKYVRKEEIYRISGDEFVVLLNDIPKENYDSKMQLLTERIAASDMPKASLGFSYGMTSRISVLLDEAEREMYVRKNEFHKAYPGYSRKTL